MHMAVNKTGREIGPGRVPFPRAVILADAGNATALHGHVAGREFAGESVEHPGVFNDQGGRALFAGHGNVVVQGSVRAGEAGRPRRG